MGVLDERQPLLKFAGLGLLDGELVHEIGVGMRLEWMRVLFEGVRVWFEGVGVLFEWMRVWFEWMCVLFELVHS